MPPCDAVRFSLIHAGTSTRHVDGGIALALRGHEAAARAAGLPCRLIETHAVGGVGEKLGPWIRSFGALRAAVVEDIARGLTPVVWAHAGEWPSMVRKASVLRWARAHGAHTVLQLHAVEVDAYLGRDLGRRVLPRLLAHADRVAVLSPWWKDRLAVEGVDTHVVPNPLPPALERVAAGPPPAGPPAGPPDGPLRVLVMTRLVPGKGVELALRAVAAMGRDVELTVAGGGPRSRALVRLAQRIGAPATFSGWVRDGAKENLLSSHHVLCHVSGHDAAPMVAVEAMARGLPVVVLNSRSVPELVPHERAGLVVQRPETDLLTVALERLRDPALRIKLGQGGRAWTLDQYSAARSAHRLTELLTTLEKSGI